MKYLIKHEGKEYLVDAKPGFIPQNAVAKVPDDYVISKDDPKPFLLKKLLEVRK